MAGQSAPPIPLEVLNPGVRHGSARHSTGANQRPPGPLRAAFLGRTSTEDQQDPTLSIPRQLKTCREALSEHGVVVAHFYDIESGRKDLSARGLGRGHERFQIPVPREGGIQDLLAEAARPDRRFDVVICESIERIARRTYVGTLIENQLEQAGIPLLAADEPIVLNGKKATQVLTRRVKQGVAEWYVLNLLEQSWGGMEAHTEQGYNTGKPPYGHTKLSVPHPVPARRAEGATKHRLTPHPVEGSVVTHIFELRVGERLGYKAIADRLNLDPDQYPPPTPVIPDRAVGSWTQSAVREVLTNPKHTGYMVWNRRATTSGHGKHNPPQAWTWSSVPSHEPLVTREVFIEAQQIAPIRERSRSASGPSTHPDTQRSYSLRSFVACDSCSRRLRGRVRHDVVYYVCDPPKGYVPEGHPKSYWIREDQLMDGLTEFFANNVFSPNRRTHLADLIAQTDDRVVLNHQTRIEAVRKTIDDLDKRRRRLVRSLETADDIDEDFMRDIRARSAEINADRKAKTQELTELEHTQPPQSRPELLDMLPSGHVDLRQIPEKIQRSLFEAFRLQMRIDNATGLVNCQATLNSAAIPAQQQAAHDAIDHARPSRTGRAGVITRPSVRYSLGST